ncbi:hypothetical protein HanIR_Chr05g0226821 [Helianthus annuus]|nr:hypothetical protein HanIR_Chr05g0226821 [Helianthus annuus]
MRTQVWRSGPSYIWRPKITKGASLKWLLTWATGVRFGRAARRNDRENEAHLSTNGRRRFGSSFGPKNAYFHELFIVLCFLLLLLDFYFVRAFGPSVF